jgi:hypothetical protein
VAFRRSDFAVQRRLLPLGAGARTLVSLREPRKALPFTLLRRAFAFVGEPLAQIGRELARVGLAVAFVGRGIAAVGIPLAVIGLALAHREFGLAHLEPDLAAVPGLVGVVPGGAVRIGRIGTAEAAIALDQARPAAFERRPVPLVLGQVALQLGAVGFAVRLPELGAAIMLARRRPVTQGQLQMPLSPLGHSRSMSPHNRKVHRRPSAHISRPSVGTFQSKPPQSLSCPTTALAHPPARKSTHLCRSRVKTVSAKRRSRKARSARLPASSAARM